MLEFLIKNKFPRDLCYFLPNINAVFTLYGRENRSHVAWNLKVFLQETFTCCAVLPKDQVAINPTDFPYLKTNETDGIKEKHEIQ